MSNFRAAIPQQSALTGAPAQRSIREIAAEIDTLWSPVNYAAVPYLYSMRRLDGPGSMYGQDDARSMVRYFLSNARSWRGPDAKRIKAELKALIGDK